MSLFTGENLTCFALAEWCRQQIYGDETSDKDMLFINVAYDRTLTTYKPNGIPLGNIDITDRQKLQQLLYLLSQTECRYIMMDVRFEKGYESDNTAIDSLLFHQIASMDNIVVANHSDMTPLNDSIATRMAYQDYYSTITSTNFIRYEYLHGDKESMPLHAYKQLYNDSILRHLGGLYYTSGSRLCYNSLFLTFPPETRHPRHIQLLGQDILSSEQPLDDLKYMAKDKVVVIGDFINDKHDTYSGMHSGPVILATSFTALVEHKHYVNWWKTLLLFILYFALTMMMQTEKRWWEYIPVLRKTRFPLLQFALSLLGYSTLILIVSFLLGLFLHVYVSFLLPSLYLSILSAYISYKHEHADALQ